MAFGFPARFAASRKFNLAEDELFAVVKSAFENLGWLGYDIQERKGFHKILHNSPMTFGEEFTLKLLPEGIVQAESKCVEGGMYRMPQIFDFGANRQNVEMFFAALERSVAENFTQSSV